MRQEVSDTVRIGNSNVRSLLRGIGRAALWAVVALLLVRGAVAVLSAQPPASGPSVASGEARLDDASATFAVRFARAYLADPSPRALTLFLAEGARVPATAPEAGAPVAQAEVAASQELGGGRAIVTVACELRDARTLYLAVPIARQGAGEVAALGAPSIVAAPAVAGVDAQRPQPLAGSDATAIEALVGKFLPAYLSASEPAALSYLLAPGAGVVPLGGAVRLLGVSAVVQLGSGEGPRRTVIANAKVRDPASGAAYPLAYRVDLVRRGRWYVDAVEGAMP